MARSLAVLLPRPRPERDALWVMLAVIVPGLALDMHAELPQQLAIGVAAWAAALAFVAGAPDRERTRMVACIGLATAGELFLSLAWGLYEYRLHNVPLFVPPGHLLLMLAGMQIARVRMPESFVAATAALVAGWGGYAAWSGVSTLDACLAVLLLACLASARNADDRRLYAVMLWLALGLEFYGTALGIWVWQPIEPWFGLTSLNPPLAAGAFYCALDALSLAVARAVHGEFAWRVPRLAWRRA
jgi:hypothetical protein